MGFQTHKSATACVTDLPWQTRKPDQYKNILNASVCKIQSERWLIWTEAVTEVQRLAAIHDPSVLMFSVSPVIQRDDGTVICVERFHRR